MRYKILIPQDVDDKGKAYLRERGYEIKMGSGISTEIIAEEVFDCDAILARTANYPAQVLQAGKKLRVIARYGTGVDNIDVKAATELGIQVVNAPVANINTVTEHTIGLIITIAKQFIQADRILREGNFDIRNQLHTVDLQGKILGLIGLGKIGNLVAKKAAAGFEMKILGYDPYVNAETVDDEIELVTDWNTIFISSDFVSLHLPSNPQTKGSVGKKEFQMMKPSALFINVARGDIVNESDMIEALNNKVIAGAALDVFEHEPPDKDNPLLKMSNVVVTPHNAALTVESHQRMSLHAAQGIDEVLSSKEPTWPVNKPVNKSQIDDKPMETK